LPGDTHCLYEYGMPIDLAFSLRAMRYKWERLTLVKSRADDEYFQVREENNAGDPCSDGRFRVHNVGVSLIPLV
jgi:hypothetical protein